MVRVCKSNIIFSVCLSVTLLPTLVRSREILHWHAIVYAIQFWFYFSGHIKNKYFIRRNILSLETGASLAGNIQKINSVYTAQNIYLNPSPAEPGIPCLYKQCWKPTDLDLHCLSLSMWICINNIDQVIWLAENWKLAWQFNLFNMTRIKRNHWKCLGEAHSCVYPDDYALVQKITEIILNRHAPINTALDKRGYSDELFSYFSMKTYVVGTH